MDGRPFLSPWQLRVVCENDESIQILLVYKYPDGKTNEVLLDLSREEIGK